MPGNWEYEKILIGSPIGGMPPFFGWEYAIAGIRFSHPLIPELNFPFFHTGQSRAPVDKARNVIVKQALDGGFTKILWIDTDTKPMAPPFVFQTLYLDMITTGASIASGIYWSKKGSVAIWKLKEKGKLPNGEIDYSLEPYDLIKTGHIEMKDNQPIIKEPLITETQEIVVGGGFMLVDIKVYQDMLKDYLEKDIPWYVYETDFAYHQNRLGEDFSFQRKAMKLGHKMVIDLRVQAIHEYAVGFDPFGRIVEVP
ncbi:MAG: hypothetical protein QW203_07390 [Thermoplasmatales archaeon]